MPIVAKTLGQVVRYVPNSDPLKGTPEEAEATYFELAPLSSRQMAVIQDATQSTVVVDQGDPKAGRQPVVETTTRTTERCYLLAQASLRGWGNFRDEAGNDVPFQVASRIVGGERVAGASDASMNRLRTQEVLELGVEANRISQPEPADLKS